ncbi:radical SAM/SPASM domain-containing protein [Clostridium butyricum]|uniref:radical SAM/SPASM domain-containing protein n=1 Tax=Clostridium butyricum TaxID=1492 RepID=UPI00374FB963
MIKYAIFGMLDELKIKLIKEWILEKNNIIVGGLDNSIKNKSEKYQILWVNPKDINILGAQKYIITSRNNYASIKNQLLNLGVKDSEILNFEHIKELYDKYYMKVFELSSITKEGILYPTTLSLEFASACNIKCIYCPYHSEFLGEKQQIRGCVLNTETTQLIINELSTIKTINNLEIGTNGEIFINKQWYENLLNLIEAFKFKEIFMLTNGMLLTQENCYKLIEIAKRVKRLDVAISIDGKDENENNIFRKGSIYETVKDNIKRLIQLIGIHEDINLTLSITNVYIPNKEEINEVYVRPVHLKGELIDIPIYDTYAVDFNVGINNEMSKLGYSKFGVKKIHKNECTQIFKSICFNSEGKLIFCPCGNAATKIIGDIRKDNVFEKWNNDELIIKSRVEFLKQGVPELCSECKYSNKKYYNIFMKGE